MGITKMSQTQIKLELGGRTITLIGTAHVSKESVEEVKESVHQYTSLDGQHFSLCGINSPASSRCMHWGPERPRGIPGLSINLGASSKETRGPRYRSEPGHSRQYLDEAKGSPRRANHQRGWDRRG